MLPPFTLAARPQLQTCHPPPCCDARGAKKGFAIRKLSTVFGKLQIEITKENCETIFFDDFLFVYLFFHSELLYLLCPLVDQVRK